MGEFDLIAKYFTRPTSRRDVLLGVGDDGAVLRVPEDRRLVVATDAIVEGVHFPEATDAFAIGYRALAVNLSDLAAMGAEPAWFTLTLSLPQNDAAWLKAFSIGLFSLADKHHIALVGGDTVRGSLNVAVHAMGLVERDRWLMRSGAKPGDAIFVSGIPGEAAAGLASIQQSLPKSAERAHLIRSFLKPIPRVELGRALRTVASAAIDVSDGLVADLKHICEQSGCGAQIELDLLPVSSSMRSLFDGAECDRFALAGGDDYELLFTVPADRVPEIQGSMAGVQCTRIGGIVEGAGVTCHRNGQQVDVPVQGYDHFA